MKITSLTGKLLIMILLVKQPGCRGHPLHIAFSYNTAVAEAVMMGYPAAVGYGHGFEAPVRMHAHSPRRVSRCKVVPGIVVEQDERIHPFH